ncbi:MAG: WD40 repeat domain-containing protein [Spirochaetales bacterium]|nr:WD40 repeat domain-containing protein [Spirochaetales bacterium]
MNTTKHLNAHFFAIQIIIFFIILTGCVSQNITEYNSVDETAPLAIQQAEASLRLVVPAGFSATINSIDVFPDSTYFITANTDNTVKLYETKSGKLVKTFLHHTGPVTDVQFVHDGDQFVSSGMDGSIIVCETKTGNMLQTLSKPDGKIFDIDVNRQNTLIAAVGFESGESYGLDVMIWDIQTGDMLDSFPAGELDDNSIAFSPDGKYLYYGEKNKVIERDIISKKTVSQFKGHSRDIYFLTLSPDGKYLASIGYDQLTNIWDTVSGELKKTITWDLEKGSLIGFGSLVCTFSPDSKYLAFTDEDKKIKLLDMHTWTTAGTYLGDEILVRAAAFIPESNILITGGNDMKPHMLDIISGKDIQLSCPNDVHIYWNAAVLSPGSWKFFGFEKTTVFTWNITKTADGQPHAILHDAEKNQDTIQFLRTSPNAQQFVSIDKTNTMVIWAVEPFLQARHIIKPHNESVEDCVFSPDSQFLATASRDKTVKMWDVETGKMVFQIESKNEAWFDTLVFSNDMKQLITFNSDAVIQEWDAATGILIKSYTIANWAYSARLAVSPDDKYIAAAVHNNIILLDRANGKKVITHALRWDGNTRTIIFSTDGKYMAALTQAHTIQFWNVETRSAPVEIFGPYTQLFAIHPSKTGEHLLLAGRGNEIAFIALPSGKTMTNMVPFSSGEVNSEWMFYTPDNQFYGTENAINRCYFENNLHITEMSEELKNKYFSKDLVFRTVQPEIKANAAIIPLLKNTETNPVLIDEETKFVVETGKAAPIHSSALTTDNSLLATGAQDGTITVWDLKYDKPPISLDKRKKIISCEL